MNYYQARQVKNPDGSGGLWHYTRMNDGHIWPAGYCAQDCPGHATAEEAEEHQKQYDIDHTNFDDFFYADSATHRSQYKCEFPGCENWTTRFARIIGGQDYTLCDAHRNKEGMAAVHRVGVVVSSY